MRLLARIETWLEKDGLFERERTPSGKRALRIAHDHEGMSYQRARKVVGRSDEAIRKWFQKAAAFFRRLPPARRKRVAVDEEVVHLPGGDAYLWAAVDLDTGEPIAVHVSWGRSNLDALWFMKRVKKMCRGRLPRVFVDGAECYPWAFQRLGFDR